MFKIVRALAASTPTLTGLMLAWTYASVWLSVHWSDWVWFQRSGSTLTIAALALAGRAMVGDPLAYLVERIRDLEARGGPDE